MKSLFVLLFLFIFSVKTQATDLEHQVGTLAFEGEMTPIQIIRELIFENIDEKFDSREIQISIPIIEDKKVLVGNIEGLPVHNQAGEIADKSVISIPFKIDLSLHKRSIEYENFFDHVESTLNLLQTSESTSKNVLNMSNCGGYPVGTTITDTWTSQQLCRQVKTTYSCMTVNGLNNWYITSNVASVLPGCYIEP